MTNPSGIIFNEYYLYADKQWEVAPSGVLSFAVSCSILQNAPVIVTSPGYAMTRPEDPWGKIEGSGKWTNRAFGDFTIDAAGVYDITVKEFAIDPGASGKVVFNQALQEPVYIEYEAGTIGYYNVDTIDINPIMRETDGGFMQISEITEPAYLSLETTKSILKGDGHQRSLLTATLWDDNLNRVKDKLVIFEMLFNIDEVSGPYTGIGYLEPGQADGSVYKIHPSGFVSETKAYTNNFGQCSAMFLTSSEEVGQAVFKAYYLDASGIFDIVNIATYTWVRGPFVLDQSILDGLDYLN